MLRQILKEIKAEEIREELLNLEYDYRENVIPYKEFCKMRNVLISELRKAEEVTI